MQPFWEFYFANWIISTWKDTLCESLVNSVWVPCLLSQNTFCKCLWKKIFSIVCHLSYRGQWSTICLSFSNAQTDLDFQPKMNYPGEIMQTNCSTETGWQSLSSWLPQFSVTITARTPVASFHNSAWPRTVVIAQVWNQLKPQLNVENPACQLKPQAIQLRLTSFLQGQVWMKLLLLFN